MLAWHGVVVQLDDRQRQLARRTWRRALRPRCWRGSCRRAARRAASRSPGRVRGRRSCASSRASFCVKRSNTCGRKPAGMPMPVSLTLSSMCESTRCSSDLDLAALGRELDRVAEQVPDDLLQAAAVCRHRRQRADRGRAVRRMSLALAPGSADSIALFTMSAQRDLLHVEPNLAGHDAAEVEQVVDQPHLRARIAVDHLEAALELFRRRGVGLALQDLRPAEDRAERRAQLVRQRREELVLDASGALRLHARVALGLEDLLALLVRQSRAPRCACCSVRSRVSLAKPSSRPWASRIAVMVTLAQNSVPSLRTRQPSSTKRPGLGGDLQLVLGPAALAHVRPDRRSRSAGR